MTYKSGIMPLKQVHSPPFTIEASGYEPIEGHTMPRRHPRAKDGLITSPAEGVNTVYDIVTRSAEKYPTEPAMGSRRLVKMHTETKKIQKVVDGEVTEVDKEWQFFELSKYDYNTYAEYLKLANDIGCGLRKMGLNKGDKLHLFAATSRNWLAMSHGCSSQSMAIVTAYDSLGAAGVEHTLVQAEADAMYIDPQLLKTAGTALDKAKTVKFVVYNDESIFAKADHSEIEEFTKVHPNVKVISFSELRQLGEENPVDPVPPSVDDLYCLMYTSGSTGLPKGVPMTHGNVVSAVAGLYTCVEECVSHSDVILTYLPLAHIFELVLENLVVFIGGTLGYGNPRTLSDASVKNCAGDMRELRPTIMVGVPQIWETVRKGVAGKVEASSPLIKALFWGAFNYKTFMSARGLPAASILDDIVFKKVRELTGGRLRFIMNGASGIADTTKHFLSMVLAPMLTGYGLTETAANGALGCPLEYTPNAIGPMPASVDVKLVSLPELNYSTLTTPPQGEIWIKGPAVCKEYFKNPEETAKTITEDGWFKTGDIGEFDKDGHLKVIDRVKNLVKMQGGEYIALEKLESVYRGSQLVQSIMVEGSGEHPRAIAIIHPNEKILAEKAAELGVGEHSMHTDPKMKSLVLKDMVAYGKKAGLSSMEIIAGVVMTDEEWTPINGMVTATQKVNRRVIREKHKAEIEECFALQK